MEKVCQIESFSSSFDVIGWTASTTNDAAITSYLCSCCDSKSIKSPTIQRVSESSPIIAGSFAHHFKTIVWNRRHASSILTKAATFWNGCCSQLPISGCSQSHIINYLTGSISCRNPTIEVEIANSR